MVTPSTSLRSVGGFQAKVGSIVDWSDQSDDGDMTGVDGCSFIIVKYGENQQVLLNPWCPSTVLIECIKKKCNCEDDDIDLIDLQGQVRNISRQTGDYASALLESRQTYILVKIEKQGDDPPKYVSLLKDMDSAHPDIQDRLVSLSQPKPRPRTIKSKWSTMKTKISVTRSLMSSRRSSSSRSTKNNNDT